MLDARVGGNIVGDPDIASNDAVVPNGDAPQDGGVGVDGDVVLDDGVTWNVEHVAVLVVLERLGTQGDALIEGDVVADDASLSDDNTRAVVDGKILANLGTGMDVNTSLRVGLLGDDAWNDRYVQLVQPMGNAIVYHRLDDGVAEDDLAVVGSCGVVVEHGLHVGIEQSLDFGQGVNELKLQALSFPVDGFLGQNAFTILAEL